MNLKVAILGLGLSAVWTVLMSSGNAAQNSGCTRWVAADGSDANPGTQELPWATLGYAAENTPDDGCTVWFKDGLYSGHNELERRFNTPTTFRAEHAYRAILEHDGPVIKINGGRNIIIEGFELRHDGPGASDYVVIMDRRDDTLWSEEIILRNNIFHDSFNNDLLKIHNGSRFITVENNIFYNQDSSEQHMDVNSVTDVVIRDNIFFNDFAGSGRPLNNDTKHYIVVKDSNEESDGLLGSRRIQIRRNIFMNWEGADQTFIKVGNDGKPYHEAIDVRVENNLMLGNSPNLIGSAFGVRGARQVTFTNNTIVGDLPSKAYAFRVDISGQNPLNEDIFFVNNIWSDPTGTMGVDLSGGDGEFSNGDPAETLNLILDNNLYWNGGTEIPPGDLVSPLIDDIHRVVADPLLNTDQQDVLLPRWTGAAFLSGNQTIRQEFIRLVNHYSVIPEGSPAIDGSDAAFAPADDILGRPRFSPDLGAYEFPVPIGSERNYLPIIYDNSGFMPSTLKPPGPQTGFCHANKR